MNKIKHIIPLILILLASWNYVSGQAKLTASCKYSNVSLNSSFQVTYTLSGGTATSFVKPLFTNFSIAGQYQSSGGGMTIYINGKQVQGGNDESTWTYELIPTATGKFTIDAAKAKVDGAWVESNTLTIEVNNSGNATTSSSAATSKSATTTAITADAGNNDIFLKAFVDKTNPYQGEQVIVTYKIYTKIPVTQYGIEKIPAYTGFWSQDLTKNSDKPTQYNETIGGAKYVVAEIRKIALFPQKSGVLKIDPLNVECVVQVVTKQKYNDPFADFFKDPFFSNFNNFGNSMFDTYSNVKKTISSNSVSLNVKALPVSNQPAEFKGSVGKFILDATLDKTNVKTNDAINLIFKITGTGNISLIDKPDIEFPTDLETYEPDVKENISATTAGISGTKTFNYLIIPRSAGDFTIKPVSFCYFDLAKGAYITLTSLQFKLKVAKGNGDNNTTVTSSNKEEIKYLNSDIRYLKITPFKLTHIGTFFYASPLFLILLLAPIVLFILFVIIYRKKIKDNSNIALMRNKKATGVALKRMKTANVYLKENGKESFLDEVFKALWGYVSDKLGIPLAELSKDTVNEKFAEKNVNEDIAKQFIDTLNNCEYARFAPADSTYTIDGIYNEAIDIITKMERELR
ncbi:MAG: BatD family protein [Bacteroidales bacterium]